MLRFVILLLLAVSSVYADKKTVCLNMIVKNESKVITRCLESVLPMIDYWVISDTGSTDGTQEIIKNYMKEKNVPGELIERPWKNFAHNRNEALDAARGKADYILFIDADEYLVYEDDFEKPDFDKDYYYFILTWPGSSWSKISIIKDKPDFKWEGVLHEVIVPHVSHTFATVEKVKNIYTVDGVRSRDPKKYQKDAEVLEAALQEDPTNSRYMFYLAKSYESFGEKEQAIKWYKKRAEVGSSYDLEACWSLMSAGQLQEQLGAPAEEVIKSYKGAVSHARNRAEPYYHLARYYRSIGDNTRCYLVASLGKTIPLPQDSFFIENWIYDYGLLMEISVSSYWIGKYKECQEASIALLDVDGLPNEYHSCAEQNLGFANQKLLEEICETTSLAIAS